MIFPHIMITYHGTRDDYASALIAGDIKVDLGSGELGLAMGPSIDKLII